MKIILLKLLALTFVVNVFLTSCSFGTNNAVAVDLYNNTVEITVWHHYKDVIKVAFDKQVKLYNETKGLEDGVFVKAIPFSDSTNLLSEIDSVLLRGSTSKNSPNISTITPELASKLYEKEKLAILDKYITEEERSEFSDYLLLESNFGHTEQYMFPFGKSVYFTYLNYTDWLKFKAEVDVDESDLRTLDGIFECARKYYDWTDSKSDKLNDGKSLFRISRTSIFLLMMFKEQGVSSFESPNSNVVIDVNSLKKIWDFYYTSMSLGYIDKFSQTAGDDIKIGNVLAYTGPSSIESHFPSEVVLSENERYKIEMRILPFPSLSADYEILLQTVTSFVVAKSNEKEEIASVNFLKWLVDIDTEIDFLIETGYLPVKTNSYQNQHLVNEIDKLEMLDTKSKNRALIFKQSSNKLSSNKLIRPDIPPSSNSAIYIFSNTMENLAQEGRELVIKYTEDGLSPDEALSKINPNEKFDEWIETIQLRLNAQNISYEIQH